MTLADLTTFLGWCTAINLGIFLVAVVAIMLAGGWMSRLHAAMFGIEPAEVRRVYFSYLGTYKIVIIVFCLVPYIVLRTAM